MLLSDLDRKTLVGFERSNPALTHPGSVLVVVDALPPAVVNVMIFFLVFELPAPGRLETAPAPALQTSKDAALSWRLETEGSGTSSFLRTLLWG